VSRGYQLTPEAQANVTEIGAFIAEDSVDAALRVLDALEHAFDQLGSTPGIGHKREDLTTRPVKFWSVHSYLIVYRPGQYADSHHLGPSRRARRRAPFEGLFILTNSKFLIPNS
jgi:plasmid stabilization system protein ParE